MVERIAEFNTDAAVQFAVFSLRLTLIHIFISLIVSSFGWCC